MCCTHASAPEGITQHVWLHEVLKKFCDGKCNENTVVCRCALNRTGRIERFGKIPNIVASLIRSDKRMAESG